MYREMRAAAAVMPVDDNMVVVCRRAEIEELFRKPEVFGSNMSAVDLQNERPLIPLQIDPPDHKKFRKILDPLFAPRQMALLEKPVAELVNSLIDGFGDRTEIDFAKEFSIPFPSQVFLTLLGLPLDDLPIFLEMKDGIIRPDHVTGGAYGTREVVAYQKQTAQSIYAYFNKELDALEAMPVDERPDNLLSRFLTTEVEGVRLTRNDILDICFLFLIAGLDTVTASLDCFFAYLSQHPEQRARLVAEPDIIPSAVEELLRWETPVMGIARVAYEDAELGGCPIKKGQQVSVLLGSANTDDDEFGDGDEVLFDREINRHLAFGGGIHRCLGSHLARMELRVAIETWLQRIPEFTLEDPSEVSWSTGQIRGPRKLPLRIG
jgi:cytochrome P450